MTDEVRWQLLYDLDKEISEMSRESMVRLELPHSWSHTSMNKDYDKGWENGFRRCVAEIKRQIRAGK